MALIEAIKDGTSEQGPCSLDANGNLKVVATGLDLGNVTITGGGDASAANQTAGNTTLTAISAGVGAPADAAAASDTATATQISLAKRLLQRTTTLIGLFPGALTASGNLKVAVLEGGTSGGATETKQDALITLIGEIQTNPTNNTLLSRLKAIADKLPTLGTQAIASSQSVTPATSSTWAVTGPLTDAQLRAASVPVSGPLTNTELRATAVPVSGPLTDTQLRATAVPVSGPLTDTQLRATAVPVSGPLTDTQLRASPVVVSAVSGYDYFSGTVAITRPATSITYAAARGLYSSGTAGAAPSVSLTLVAGGAVPIGSMIMITSVSIHASTPSPTVLPLLDVLFAPDAFTAVADNAIFAVPTATLQTGVWASAENGMQCETSGGVAWTYSANAPIKLAAASSALYLQPRVRQAYVSAASDVFTIKIGGYVV